MIMSRRLAALVAAVIGDIWTVRPDGRGRQQVSHSTRFEFRPDWGH